MSEDDDELERLRKEIRELKSINRGLLTRLKKVDRESRNAHQRDFIEDKKEEKKSDCPTCGKGIIMQVEIVGRKFERCNLCDYRKKAKQ